MCLLRREGPAPSTMCIARRLYFSGFFLLEVTVAPKREEENVYLVILLNRDLSIVEKIVVS